MVIKMSNMHKIKELKEKRKVNYPPKWDTVKWGEVKATTPATRDGSVIEVPCTADREFELSKTLLTVLESRKDMGDVRVIYSDDEEVCTMCSRTIHKHDTFLRVMFNHEPKHFCKFCVR